VGWHPLASRWMMEVVSYSTVCVFPSPFPEKITLMTLLLSQSKHYTTTKQLSTRSSISRLGTLSLSLPRPRTAGGAVSSWTRTGGYPEDTSSQATLSPYSKTPTLCYCPFFYLVGIRWSADGRIPHNLMHIRSISFSSSSSGFALIVAFCSQIPDWLLLYHCLSTTSVSKLPFLSFILSA
jgi:hypothetical protein